MDYVLELAVEHSATVLLSGDIYNNHGVIDAEVQRFWIEWFWKAKRQGVSSIILEGNHDRPGTTGTRASALLAHVEHATVVKSPRTIDGIVFLPYMTNEEVIEQCNHFKSCPVVICHATFDGAKYENGFLAPDGIDQTAIPQVQVIGGHIHTPSEFGKVWYPGAPRWRSKADANVDRAVWLLEFDYAHNLKSRTPFDTSTVCKKIHHLMDTEEHPLEAFVPVPGHDYRVDIHGSKQWIEARAPLYKGQARIRTVTTDAKARVVVKESDGLAVAFHKWLENFRPKFGTPANDLLNLSRDRLHGIVV